MVSEYSSERSGWPIDTKFERVGGEKGGDGCQIVKF